jgi:DNA excision repair protein ERCC-3
MEAKPLIIQSDMSLMLDTHASSFEEARAQIAMFAELEKSPEHFHIYRISNLSIWNAAASGVSVDEIMEILNANSRFPVPVNIPVQVSESYKRYGRLLLTTGSGDELLLTTAEKGDWTILKEISAQKSLRKYLGPAENGYTVKALDRGTVKQLLIKLGWPVKDLVPLKAGAPFAVALNDRVRVRDYQREATDVFLGRGKPGSGFGVVVLPCGAGKTVVGIDVMTQVKNETLILAANVAAARQWIREIIDKTDISPDQVGEYSGASKAIKPVTVATYQILVWRKDKESEFEHFRLFTERRWGLIIYDEAHLLPAPVFRITAEIQSIRRLGLTATLVREDHAEEDVFSLIGPKRYDMPWRDLEKKGWIASAYCIEVKVDFNEEERIKYAVAERRQKIRLAAENRRKQAVAAAIIRKHEGESILVMGQYLEQLKELSAFLKAPLITGKMPHNEREIIYEKFRNGEVKLLVVSKVANFSIDLPDASVAVQISGTFGSRQEEAQRLGRILRPKECSCYFYSLVSRFTEEELFSANRQKFLAEQGYTYQIEDESTFI